MNYPESQPEIIFQISFYTTYDALELYEQYFIDQEYIGTSSNEIYSETVENMDSDLWKIDVLTNSQPNLPELAQELEEISSKHNIKFLGLHYKPLADKDWVAEYHKQLKPIIIDRFFIAPYELDQECPEDKEKIYIEASRAFGTGDHATTELCIRATASINRHSIHNILDIGTGSGILSFAAEKIWPGAKIFACDIDPVSVDIANRNKISNNSAISFYQNTAESLNFKGHNIETYDLIISNILAQPLINMAPDIKKLSAPNAYIILSGFLDYQMPQVQESYEKQGFKLIESLQDEKWCCLLMSLNIQLGY